MFVKRKNMNFLTLDQLFHVLKWPQNTPESKEIDLKNFPLRYKLLKF